MGDTTIQKLVYGKGAHAGPVACVDGVSPVGASMVTHSFYHAGQIALLRRQAGAWPPERGGDTW